jgi:demethylmenaquinone methyltransferase/2-methoxy-6-polyprenyl-1,4-benzoquinol methylase
MAHTLELFDTPEIPTVLQEVKRVLRAGGRLGVASISKTGGCSLMLRLYEWAHTRWPKHIDCRPIYVECALNAGGFEVRSSHRASLFGLPEEIVVATKSS